MADFLSEQWKTHKNVVWSIICRIIAIS